LGSCATETRTHTWTFSLWLRRIDEQASDANFLSGSRVTNKGSVIMFSRDVENEKKHFDRAQGKRGAESGF
jgi:hypothetical protein